MLRHLIALSALLALPTNAQALELGVQDDGRPSPAVLADVNTIGGGWTRTIAYVGQHGVADRIRAAHHAGLRIILTVGGTGTRTRKPVRRDVLAYLSSLPRADKYSVINEPDLSGMRPCTYRKLWVAVRKRYGRRLLYGDFSPHAPTSYTAQVVQCGRLPHKLDVAVHPYQYDDPLRPTAMKAWSEGCMGCLGRARKAFKGMGLKVSWWLDEFGYDPQINSDAQAAWLWPRAIRQATRQHARVLIAYTARGGSWDTRPGALAWCSLTRGRACPGAVRPDVHRLPPPRASHLLDYAFAQVS